MSIEESIKNITTQEIKHFNVVIAPFHDDNNRIIGTIGASIEVTEEKRKAAKAKKEKVFEQLKMIAPFIPANVYWLDENNIILGVNEKTLQAIGLSSYADIIGKTVYDLYPKDLADKIAQHHTETIKTRKTLKHEEVIKDVKTGETKYFTTVKTPIYDDAKVIGSIGISIDITERKKMEEELVTAKEKAESAVKAKAEFLRNMEHQLRTPFSGVYSLVQMLADQETDPAKKELLEITYSSGKELLDFLNDVINFSRDQVETPAIIAKKFDLKRLIERAVIMEKPAAVMKGLTLSFTYPEDLPTIFINDPKRIQRIVLNLLSNAVKFTTKGAISVAVKLGKKLDEKNYILRIIIKDTGIGIAKDNQSLIYEKFYRVSPANQNKYAGAGLGLHIVKQLVTELEGEIDVQSQLDKGTTFICTLLLKRPLIDEVIDDKEEPRGLFDQFN